MKNASFPLEDMSQQDYEDIFHASVQEYTSMMGADDPDLGQFRDNGGKIISWHGLADELIFPTGTAHYYDRAEELDPDVRHFLQALPGSGCGALLWWRWAQTENGYEDTGRLG